MVRWTIMMKTSMVAIASHHSSTINSSNRPFWLNNSNWLKLKLKALITDRLLDKEVLTQARV